MHAAYSLPHHRRDGTASTLRLQDFFVAATPSGPDRMPPPGRKTLSGLLRRPVGAAGRRAQIDPDQGNHVKLNALEDSDLTRRAYLLLLLLP